MPEQDRMLTIEEAMEHVGRGRSTIQQWRHDGLITFHWIYDCVERKRRRRTSMLRLDRVAEAKSKAMMAGKRHADT